MKTTKVKQNIDKKRLKEFAQSGLFDVHTSGDKIMSIGLQKGDSKYWETLGYKRKEQIKMLDFMQDNPKQLKKLLGMK